MGVTNILAEIDLEIAQLQRARALLTGEPAPATTKRKYTKRAGKAATNKQAGKKKKRNISPEGRKRIIEAVKRRWAEQKKAESK